MKAPQRVFLPEDLGNPSLLSIVLGREVSGVELDVTQLENASLHLADPLGFPGLEMGTPDVVRGAILLKATQIDVARIRYFLDVLSGSTRLQNLNICDDQVFVFVAKSEPNATCIAFDVNEWRSAHLDILEMAAEEIMGHFGDRPSAALRPHINQIRARARAKLAAKSHAPQNLRSGGGPISTEAVRRPYLGFFAVEERDFRFETFQGEPSDLVSRAGFVVPDAATILPYDPVNDLVLLIEQCRFGPILRADPLPWQLEAIAGHINEGETAEETVVREAQEEAALAIQSVELIGKYYSTPGALSEHVTSFIGIAELSNYTEGVHGLAEETEDIRAFVVPFSKLESALRDGEVNNGPLLISTLWLAQHRSRLRDCAAIGPRVLETAPRDAYQRSTGQS